MASKKFCEDITRKRKSRTLVEAHFPVAFRCLAGSILGQEDGYHRGIEAIIQVQKYWNDDKLIGQDFMSIIPYDQFLPVLHIYDGQIKWNDEANESEVANSILMKG